MVDHISSSSYVDIFKTGLFRKRKLNQKTEDLPETGSTGITKKDLEEALKMADFAYKDTESETTPEQVAFIEKLQKEGYRLTFFDTPAEFSGVVARKGNEMTISYHGTEDMSNVESDLEAWKVPVNFADGTVHAGFYHAFEASKPVLDGIFHEQVSQMLASSTLDKQQLIADMRKRLNSVNREFYNQLVQDAKANGTRSDKAAILNQINELRDLSDDQLLAKVMEMSKHPQMDSYKGDLSGTILREVVQYAGMKQAKLTFDGHSLGAAETTIAAFYYTKKYGLDPKNVQVFTFGSPRVFDDKMAAEYNRLLGSRTYRVSEHDQDIVPTVPFGWMDYKHVGENIRVDKLPKDTMHKLTGYKDAIDQLPDGVDLKYDNEPSFVESKWDPLFYVRHYVMLPPQYLLSEFKTEVNHMINGKDSDVIDAGKNKQRRYMV